MRAIAKGSYAQQEGIPSRWQGEGEDAGATRAHSSFPIRRRIEARYLTAAVVLALVGLLAAGCASTRIQAQWTDPKFSDHALHEAKVLVVCEASETAIKRICQEQMAAQVQAAGATPVSAPGAENLKPGSGPADGALLDAARNLGAKAVLVATLAPDATIVNPGPSIGIGLGGFGGSGGGGSLGGGVGVSMPVGGASTAVGYGANIVLTDVATGRLMWTSKVTTPPTQNISAQVGELAKTGLGAAVQAGVF
jgi:hypothetical protein